MHLARVGIVVLALGLSSAFAVENNPMKEAAAHFQRGVQLYNEADYRGALVEFKRANALAPNVQVVYNIAQTYYQLQDYANALTSFESYLGQAPPGAPHRSEAESTLATLRTRVARLTITTKPEGVEVTVDDEPVGTTPLGKPVIVSLGRRKVVATRPGFQPATRYVEVAAGDQTNVDLALIETAPAQAPIAVEKPIERKGVNKAAVATVWVLTGLLAAGWLATGALALSASNDLTTARDAFPTTRATLDDKANNASNLALVSDVFAGLTAAAAVTAIVVTAIQVKHADEPITLRLQPGLGSFFVHGSF